MNDKKSRPRLGISSCLLGEKVRYDGKQKRDHALTGSLGPWFEFMPVCPEVGIGLGVPRPPIQLEGDPSRPRAVGVTARDVDVTERLEAYSREKVAALPPLCGFILKSRSPSCGMRGVEVHGPDGQPVGTGSGVFARILMEMRPELPVEEEGRLGDPALRDNFLERVFTLQRWHRLTKAGLSAEGIIAFHSAHKLALMAHGKVRYRTLGQQVAAIGGEPLGAFAREYIQQLMAALRHPATAKQQSDVLQHLMGYLKRQLGAAEKAELLEAIEAYRAHHAPLLVPLTLLRHHFRRHPHPYVEQQTYLYREPAELMLRCGGG